MKHQVLINVSKQPINNNIISFKRFEIRERLSPYLLDNLKYIKRN